MQENPGKISPFAIKAADKLAVAVNTLVRRGLLDARSPAADALLNYASLRFGDQNPIGDLEKQVASYEHDPSRHR